MRHWIAILGAAALWLGAAPPVEAQIDKAGGEATTEAPKPPPADPSKILTETDPEPDKQPS